MFDRGRVQVDILDGRSRAATAFYWINLGYGTLLLGLSSYIERERRERGEIWRNKLSLFFLGIEEEELGGIMIW